MASTTCSLAFVLLFASCALFSDALPHSQRLRQSSSVHMPRFMGGGITSAQEICVKASPTVLPGVKGQLLLSGSLSQNKKNAMFTVRGSFQLGATIGAGPATINPYVTGEVRIDAAGCKDWAAIFDTWSAGVIGATLDAQKAALNEAQKKEWEASSKKMAGFAKRLEKKITTEQDEDKANKMAGAAGFLNAASQRQAKLSQGCVVKWEGSVKVGLGKKGAKTCMSQPVYVNENGYFMSGEYKMGEKPTTTKSKGTFVGVNPSSSFRFLASLSQKQQALSVSVLLPADQAGAVADLHALLTQKNNDVVPAVQAVAALKSDPGSPKMLGLFFEAAQALSCLTADQVKAVTDSSKLTAISDAALASLNKLLEASGGIAKAGAMETLTSTLADFFVSPQKVVALRMAVVVTDGSLRTERSVAALIDNPGGVTKLASKTMTLATGFEVKYQTGVTTDVQAANAFVDPAQCA